MSLKTQMDLNFKNKQSTIASYLTKISQLFIFVFFYQIILIYDVSETTIYIDVLKSIILSIY